MCDTVYCMSMKDTLKIIQFRQVLARLEQSTTELGRTVGEQNAKMER